MKIVHCLIILHNNNNKDLNLDSWMRHHNFLFWPHQHVSSLLLHPGFLFFAVTALQCGDWRWIMCWCGGDSGGGSLRGFRDQTEFEVCGPIRLQYWPEAWLDLQERALDEKEIHEMKKNRWVCERQTERKRKCEDILNVFFVFKWLNHEVGILDVSIHGNKNGAILQFYCII